MNMIKLLMIYLTVTLMCSQNYLMKFKRFKEGLSHTTISSIYIDEKGLLWLTTQTGLNQFNSIDFTLINKEDGLADNFVTAMLEDNNGNYWIGTANGLSFFDHRNQTFTTFRHDAKDASTLSHSYVNYIFQDDEERIWVGTERGLNLLNQNNTFTRFLSKPDLEFTLRNDFINHIESWGSDRLLIGTEGGLHFLNLADMSFKLIRQVGEKPITDIKKGSTGYWITSLTNGVFKIDYDTEQISKLNLKVLDGNELTSIQEDHNGLLWIGTSRKGVYRYNKSTKKFNHYLYSPTDLQSINADDIYDIKEDSFHNIWFATGNGLARIDNSQNIIKHYKIVREQKKYEDNVIFPMIEDRNGKIWLGTFKGGLSSFDPETEQFEHFVKSKNRNSINNNSVQAIFEDKDGILWLGTFLGGLNRFDPVQKRFKQYTHDPKNPYSISSNYVFRIQEDSEGYLWIATGEGGLNRFDKKTERFRNWRHDENDPNSLASDYLYTVYVDSDDDIWLAAGVTGLTHYDKVSDKFTVYKENVGDTNSISHGDVLDIYEDSKKRLWVTTNGGGVNLFDKKTGIFKQISEKDGLLYDFTYNVVEDDSNYIWITTFKGISRYNPDTKEFKNFDQRDGMQSNEFNESALVKRKTGEIVTGGINGFNVFHPNQIKESTAPEIAFTDFRLTNMDDQTAQNSLSMFNNIKNDIINLSHKQNNFDIKFIALDYTVPEKNQYAYKMSGFSESWRYLNQKNDISFTNLAPGEYLFTVKAANSDNVWNEAGKTLTIIINPPFWQTVWFRLILLTIVVALILYFYRRRVKFIQDQNKILNDEISHRKKLIKALESKNAEMERFTYTVSHDLKSPLITIQGFLGALNAEIDEKSESTQKYINYMSEGIEKMNYLLEDLLELSRIGRMITPPETVSLKKIIDEALANVRGRFDQNKIDLKLDEDLPNVHVDRQRMVEVYQNLIENAIKFMGDQKEPVIEIGMKNDNDSSVYFVKDNGIGIEEKYHKKVFGLFERLNPNNDGTGIGLALVNRIIELHEGKIWIESEGKNNGTTFYFTLNKNGNN